MKALIFLTGFFLVCSYNLFCQASNSIVIKPGDDLTEAYHFIYKYPVFKYGKIYFRNGDSSAAKLNYDYLRQAIQFIDQKKDTLAIDNEGTIKFISIDEDTFLYKINKGYLEQIGDYSVTKLLLKENIVSSEEKIGAFGIPSSTHDIDTKSDVISVNSYLLTINSNVTLTKNKQYYFSDHFTVLPVNNKNIMRVFAKQKMKIEDYLQSNNTNFTKEDDLKKFFNYVKTIL
jgi:hypothetical protein